jgi:hypothetical protein
VADADYLIAQAQAIIDAINNGTVECPEEDLGLRNQVITTQGSIAQIYPNPASDHITIDLSQLPAANYSLQMLDLRGQVAYTRAVQEGAAPQLQISIRDYPAGVYFIRITGDHTHVQTLKLVIE